MISFAKKPIAAIAAVILSAGLPACAVRGPATIQLSNAATQSINSVEFPSMVADDSLRSHWGAALSRSFQNQSVKIEKTAPFIADFALSVRDAESGLANPAEAGGEIDWQSAPRESRLLDICKAKRMRGSLVIFDRTTGAIAYKGESEADGCKFSQPDFDTMAALLVADAVK